MWADETTRKFIAQVVVSTLFVAAGFAVLLGDGRARIGSPVAPTGGG